MSNVQIPTLGIGRILALIGLVVVIVLGVSNGFSRELMLFGLAFLAILI